MNIRKREDEHQAAMAADLDEEQQAEPSTAR